MKKVLFFAAMLCGFVALNAQTPIALLYNGECYQSGDTVVVTLAKTAHNCDAIGFRNQTSGAIQNVVVNMTEIESNGVEAWGLCTGDQCVPTLTSAAFVMTPGDYTTFTIDVTIDNVERPYGVYNLTVGSSLVNSSFVVRFNAYEETVGINDVVANSTVNAYPNPAQGQVNFNYSVEHPATLAIYDVQGRVVRQMNVCGEGTLQVNGLAAGIYAYGIAGSQMHKLIVK